ALNFALERDSHDNYVKNVSTNPAPFETAANLGAFGGVIPGPFFAHIMDTGVIPFPLSPAAQLACSKLAAICKAGGVHLPSGVGNQNIWAMDTKMKIDVTNNFKITLAGDFTSKNDTNGYQYYETTPATAGAIVKGFLSAVAPGSTFSPDFINSTTAKFTTT